VTRLWAAISKKAEIEKNSRLAWSLAAHADGVVAILELAGREGPDPEGPGVASFILQNFEEEALLAGRLTRIRWIEALSASLCKRVLLTLRLLLLFSIHLQKGCRVIVVKLFSCFELYTLQYPLATMWHKP
jgi:hypothetical protein